MYPTQREGTSLKEIPGLDLSAASKTGLHFVVMKDSGNIQTFVIKLFSSSGGTYFGMVECYILIHDIIEYIKSSFVWERFLIGNSLW